MEDKKMPVVSVLTTCYNRERFLGESIESVLASTLTNFELIIVDDRSVDNSLAVAKHYAALDDRIRVYQNEVNLGDYPNRNRAASYARGKYLKYLDADDYIYPHCLQQVTDTMEMFPKAGLGLAMREFFGPKPEYLDPETAIRTNYLQYELFLSSPLSSVIRRDAFEAVGGFSGKRYVGDAELWILLAKQSGLVKLLPGFGYWRQHDAQESKSEAKDIAGNVARYRFAMDILQEVAHFFSADELELIKNRINRKYARLFFRKLYSGEFKSAEAIKSETGKSFVSLLRDARQKV
ncbi:MAG: glycosyltransferase family 2 protein [Chitinophagaceae bacterium]|nr:MAG: glycosyltransferase family 2 protein [Chitinophagaceae bacterium]